MFENGQTFGQFLDDYYKLGPKGYLNLINLAQRGKINGDDDVQKILTAGETNYYENRYMKEVQIIVATLSELYKLLDKKPMTAIGDSYKYITSYGVDTTALGPGGAEAIFGSETEPSVLPINGITSGVEKVILSRELHAQLKEAIAVINGQEPTWDWLRNNIAPKALYNKIDTWLGGRGISAANDGVETPALKNIECVDRMISCKAESGATNHVSANTDGDIYWNGLGTGSPKIARATDTWADAQVKLPATPGTAESYHITEELDDVMTACKKYSAARRFIGLTTAKTLKKINAEHGSKERFLERDYQVAASIGGLNTRAGPTAGFNVAGLRLSGVDVPFFESEALPITNSVYGTATSGHVYLIDLDTLFIRVDIPVTYLETGFGAEMLNQNYLRSRAMLFTVCQLMCTNFQANGALKWIKA